jgi:hypothetical protein
MPKNFRYKTEMKLSPLSFALFIVIIGTACGAGSENFTGEFADKKFMNGQAVFQLSLEQSGNDVSVFFNAVRNDGQGAAPEGDAKGHVTGKGTVEFKFEDSFNNSGTGTITRAGDDVILSMKMTHVADSRCLPFYPDNLRLKRVKK